MYSQTSKSQYILLPLGVVILIVLPATCAVLFGAGIIIDFSLIDYVCKLLKLPLLQKSSLCLVLNGLLAATAGLIVLCEIRMFLGSGADNKSLVQHAPRWVCSLTFGLAFVIGTPFFVQYLTIIETFKGCMILTGINLLIGAMLGSLIGEIFGTCCLGKELSGRGGAEVSSGSVATQTGVYSRCWGPSSGRLVEANKLITQANEIQ